MWPSGRAESSLGGKTEREEPRLEQRLQHSRQALVDFRGTVVPHLTDQGLPFCSREVAENKGRCWDKRQEGVVKTVLFHLKEFVGVPFLISPSFTQG